MTTAKKAKKATPQKGAAQNAPASARKEPLVEKQPRSKEQAAQAAGMVLAVDDSWATPYFDDSDLHSLERKLFG